MISTYILNKIPFGWARITHGTLLPTDMLWSPNEGKFIDPDIDSSYELPIDWFHCVIRMRANTFAERRKLALSYVPDGFNPITYDENSEDRVSRECLVWDEYNGEFLAATAAEIAHKVNDFVAVVRPSSLSYDPVIGYFMDGDFLCADCVLERKRYSHDDQTTPVQVYESNMRPYSQTCHNCGAVCYAGGVSTILFNPKRSISKDLQPILEPDDTIELMEIDDDDPIKLELDTDPGMVVITDPMCELCIRLVNAGYGAELVDMHHMGDKKATRAIRMDNRALNIIGGQTHE